MQEEMIVMFVKYFVCFECPKFLSEKDLVIVVVFQPIGRNGIFYTSPWRLNETQDFGHSFLAGLWLLLLLIMKYIARKLKFTIKRF